MPPCCTTSHRHTMLHAQCRLSSSQLLPAACASSPCMSPHCQTNVARLQGFACLCEAFLSVRPLLMAIAVPGHWHQISGPGTVLVGPSLGTNPHVSTCTNAAVRAYWAAMLLSTSPSEAQLCTTSETSPVRSVCFASGRCGPCQV